MKRLIIISAIILLLASFSVLAAQSRMPGRLQTVEPAEEIAEEVKEDKAAEKVVIPVVEAVKSTSSSRDSKQSSNLVTSKPAEQVRKQSEPPRETISRGTEQGAPAQREIRQTRRRQPQPAYRQRGTTYQRDEKLSDKEISEQRENNNPSARQSFEQQRNTETKPSQTERQTAERDNSSRNSRNHDVRPERQRQIRTRQARPKETKPVQLEQDRQNVNEKDINVRSEESISVITEREKPNQERKNIPPQKEFKPQSTTESGSPQPAENQIQGQNETANAHSPHHNQTPQHKDNSIQIIKNDEVPVNGWQPPKHIWGGYAYHGGHYHNNFHWWHGHHNRHGWWGFYPHHSWNWHFVHRNWVWANMFCHWNWYYPFPHFFHFGYYSYVNYYHWYPHHFWIIYPRFSFYYSWLDRTSDFTGFIVANDWGLETNQHYDDNIDYEPYFDADINWHTDDCPRFGYGMFIRNRDGEYGFYHFDRYGSRLAERIMRNSRNPNRKMYVEVRGVLDRSTHTIRVVSMNRLSWRENVLISINFLPRWLYHRPYYWG